MTERVTRRNVIKAAGGAAGAAGLGSLAGCVGFGGGSGGTVKVSSKKFTEERILGYLAYEVLKENTDLNVVDKIGLGGTTQNFKAVKGGQIDVYWEYTGTVWTTFPPKHSKVVHDPKQLYQKVKSDLQSHDDLEMLARAPYNNTYVLVANPDWVKKTGVKTLSGLAKYLDGGNTDMTIVMDAEFQQRSDGWPGLSKHYGFADAAKNVNIKNVGSDLSYQIVGKGQADIGMGFNTNPQILKFDLQVLTDDKQFFPVYNPAPVVNGKTFKNDPSMKDPLDSVGPKLTTERIRNLNKQVSIKKKDAHKVAKSFLSDHGLI